MLLVLVAMLLSLSSGSAWSTYPAQLLGYIRAVYLLTGEWESMDVSVHSMSNVDLRALSSFILKAKQASGVWRSETTLDHVENAMKRSFADTADIVVLAEEKGVPVGCLVLHYKAEKQAEVNPWFLGGLPIALPGDDASEVSESLLQTAIAVCTQEGISRLELSFPRDQHSDSVKSLLQGHGFSVLEEIQHMRAGISELTIKASPLPETVERRPLFEANRESLYECWYEAFRSGEDRSFLTLGEQERKAFFEEAFDFTDDLIEAASCALYRGAKMIGFALVRPTHGAKNGHLWQMGVLPECRGTGLAKYLLTDVCARLEEADFETLSLNVDLANRPAYELYRASGLQDDWCLVSYEWRPTNQ